MISDGARDLEVPPQSSSSRREVPLRSPSRIFPEKGSDAMTNFSRISNGSFVAREVDYSGGVILQEVDHDQVQNSQDNFRGRMLVSPTPGIEENPHSRSLFSSRSLRDSRESDITLGISTRKFFISASPSPLPRPNLSPWLSQSPQSTPSMQPTQPPPPRQERIVALDTLIRALKTNLPSGKNSRIGTLEVGEHDSEDDGDWEFDNSAINVDSHKEDGDGSSNHLNSWGAAHPPSQGGGRSQDYNMDLDESDDSIDMPPLITDLQDQNASRPDSQPQFG
ncbi:hypothetical protein IFR05_002329 [Cadophora sp. M221]|nr:hypothetical protein IFR05_002329 [Cadophora sp. M221]